MAVRFYPHAEAHGLAGTFPSGEQDAQAPNFSATGATTLLGMSTRKGDAMTYKTASSTATTSPQAGFIGFWTTAPLDSNQTVGGAAETISINIGAYESNLSANLNYRAHVYVWRPSTGALVGNCCSYSTVPSDTTAEPSSASSIRVATMIVDLAGVSALAGDVIVVELWTSTTQAAASSYTLRTYYDGNTETATEGNVVTDHAAYFEFSQNLTFTVEEARVTAESAIVIYDPGTVEEARVTAQSAIIFYTPIAPSTVTESVTATDAVTAGISNSTLFWDSTGQLVIAASLPPGGTQVPDPASNNLVNLAPWMRELDSDFSANWHPGNYYSGGREAINNAAGGNLMPNSDLSFGIDYWSVLNVAGGGTNYAGPTWDLSSNAPAQSHSVGISRTGTTLAASDTFDIIYTRGVNVLPSTDYEVSAYLAAINCAASIFVRYYKLVAGVETYISASSVMGSVTVDGGVDLSSWERAGAIITTPADCQYMKFVIRGGAAIAADPKFWAAKLFIGQAFEGQTELSPWTPGGNSGAFGELQQLSYLHEEYVPSISVPNITLTTIISLSFTSIISPSRDRKMIVSVTAEGSNATTKVIISISSGSYTADKSIFEVPTGTDTRMLAFMSPVSVPEGYDNDITIDIKVKHNVGTAKTFSEINMSVLEIAT